MTAQRWLDTWEATLRAALDACADAPTFVFRSGGAIDDVDGTLHALHAALTRAGVRGLAIPAPDEVEAQVKAHIKVKRGAQSRTISPRTAANFGLVGGTAAVMDTSTPTMTPSQVRREGEEPGGSVAGLRREAPSDSAHHVVLPRTNGTTWSRCHCPSCHSQRTGSGQTGRSVRKRCLNTAPLQCLQMRLLTLRRRLYLRRSRSTQSTARATAPRTCAPWPARC